MDSVESRCACPLDVHKESEDSVPLSKRQELVTSAHVTERRSGAYIWMMRLVRPSQMWMTLIHPTWETNGRIGVSLTSNSRVMRRLKRRRKRKGRRIGKGEKMRMICLVGDANVEGKGAVVEADAIAGWQGGGRGGSLMNGSLEMMLWTERGLFGAPQLNLGSDRAALCGFGLQ